MQTIQHHSQEILGMVSISSFGVGTLPIINEYLQMLAFIVAIVSGGIVIWKHFKGKSHESRKDK